MGSLVSVAQFCTRTGSTAPRQRISALLGDATAAVLAESHGQTIAAATSTDTRVFNYEGRFYLPQRPVTDIASVMIDGEELTTDDYRWEPGGNRRPAVIIRRVDGADARFTAAEATVTYSHGWSDVPGQITSIIVAMVRDALSRGPGGETVTGTTLGQFSEQYAQSAFSADMAVPDSAKATLDRLCGVDRHASVPIPS